MTFSNPEQQRPGPGKERASGEAESSPLLSVSPLPASDRRISIQEDTPYVLILKNLPPEMVEELLLECGFRLSDQQLSHLMDSMLHKKPLDSDVLRYAHPDATPISITEEKWCEVGNGGFRVTHRGISVGGQCVLEKNYEVCLQYTEGQLDVSIGFPTNINNAGAWQLCEDLLRLVYDINLPEMLAGGNITGVENNAWQRQLTIEDKAAIMTFPIEPPQEAAGDERYGIREYNGVRHKSFELNWLPVRIQLLQPKQIDHRVLLNLLKPKSADAGKASFLELSGSDLMEKALDAVTKDQIIDNDDLWPLFNTFSRPLTVKMLQETLLGDDPEDYEAGEEDFEYYDPSLSIIDPGEDKEEEESDGDEYLHEPVRPATTICFDSVTTQLGETSFTIRSSPLWMSEHEQVADDSVLFSEDLPKSVIELCWEPQTATPSSRTTHRAAWQFVRSVCKLSGMQKPQSEIVKQIRGQGYQITDSVDLVFGNLLITLECSPASRD